MNIGGFNAATGAATMAAAAAAEARRQHEEEEEMTPYDPVELDGDWEFKILRSMTGAFAKPEMLRRALEEEALSGWILVEKFDNNRIRLKRLTGANHDEFNPNVDPYRTTWGTSNNRFAVITLGLTFAAMLVAGGVFAFFLAR